MAKPTRSQTGKTQERVFTLVESFLGMVIMLIGTQIPSLKLSISLLVTVCLLEFVVIWRLGFFEKWRLRNQWIGNVILGLTISAGLFGMWWFLRPTPDFKSEIKNFAMGDLLSGEAFIHLSITINNDGAPAIIQRWELSVRPRGGAAQVFVPTHPSGDTPVQMGERKIETPVNSQDLLDRVDAITKETPAVGTLSFYLKGLRQSDLQDNRTLMSLSFYDKDRNRFVVQPDPFVVGEKNIAPEHIPGMKDRLLPMSPTP